MSLLSSFICLGLVLFVAVPYCKAQNSTSPGAFLFENITLGTFNFSHHNSSYFASGFIKTGYANFTGPLPPPFIESASFAVDFEHNRMMVNLSDFVALMYPNATFMVSGDLCFTRRNWTYFDQISSYELLLQTDAVFKPGFNEMLKVYTGLVRDVGVCRENVAITLLENQEGAVVGWHYEIPNAFPTLENDTRIILGWSTVFNVVTKNVTADLFAFPEACRNPSGEYCDMLI